MTGLEFANILGPCVLGHPTSDPDAGPLVLGHGVTVRAYAVLYQGTVLGEGVHVAHGATIRENNVIDQGASINASVEVWPGNRIGARTRIGPGCFLEGVTLGRDVFCGPRVVFTDDPHPPCPSYLACVGGATVGDGASIGANATILPGVTIGDRSLIGAGSVVTKDVEADHVVAGNPARCLGRRDELGCKAGIYEHAYAWLESIDLRDSGVESSTTAR